MRCTATMELSGMRLIFFEGPNLKQFCYDSVNAQLWLFSQSRAVLIHGFTTSCSLSDDKTLTCYRIIGNIMMIFYREGVCIIDTQ